MYPHWEVHILKLHTTHWLIADGSMSNEYTPVIETYSFVESVVLRMFALRLTIIQTALCSLHNVVWIMVRWSANIDK